MLISTSQSFSGPHIGLHKNPPVVVEGSFGLAMRDRHLKEREGTGWLEHLEQTDYRIVDSREAVPASLSKCRAPRTLN